MSNNYGEISWNEDVFGTDNKKPAKDLFVRLDDNGPNEMRLVTQPYQYLSHRYKKEGDPGYGNKVYCSAANGGCPLCDAGDKAKPRWLLGVISRNTGTYKILDISFAIFSQIRKLARNTQRWGDPTKYDIDIVVDKNAGPTGYYSVQPIAKEPLSAADQVLRDNADLEDLKRRVTPPTSDQVQNRIDKINGVDDEKAAPAPAKGKVTKTAKPATVNMEEDDEEFPAYQAK